MKRYTSTCFIGVVGGESEIGECHDSITAIGRRMGDTPPNFYRGTKGYECRQLHINKFMDSDHEFLLLLDHDMIFPVDTLERLRSHLLPYVSGYYLRRNYAPVAPVWFEPGDVFPFQPWLHEPERGKLHELGASGWGCLLIHREVIQATREILKGEPDVIEDDCDVYPYDLETILTVLRGMDELTNHPFHGSGENLRALIRPFIGTLINEIRPLRVMKNSIGSDIRYPFYAKLAGYTLFGDPEVRCNHMLNYPLRPDDYSNVPEEDKIQVRQSSIDKVNAEREEIRQLVERLVIR